MLRKLSSIFSAGRGKKARFATELVAGLRRFNVGKEEMDRALAELEAEGTVVVRENFCADPHLAEVDLRVIALVEISRGDEAHAAALPDDRSRLEQWLGEYGIGVDDLGITIRMLEFQ